MFNFEESFFVEKEIAVSAEKAWEIIAMPGNLTLWHPFMEKHITERWDGVGSKDHLTYYSGFEFDREVVKWIDGIGYDLRVTENGKRENSAIWRITPIDDQRCTLKITGRVEFIKKLPLPIRWALIKFKMKPLFSRYLFQILEGFAFYAETGTKVKRDQFGPHPIFSK
ncbi:SRPBCC family protein [Desulfobacterales bacterium HSG16]|nr:SRPBCC family protein [Desulfobacterales bacterium HSG16]